MTLKAEQACAWCTRPDSAKRSQTCQLRLAKISQVHSKKGTTGSALRLVISALIAAAPCPAAVLCVAVFPRAVCPTERSSGRSRPHFHRHSPSALNSFISECLTPDPPNWSVTTLEHSLRYQSALDWRGLELHSDRKMIQYSAHQLTWFFKRAIPACQNFFKNLINDLRGISDQHLHTGRL